MSHLYKQKAVYWLAYSIHGKLYRKSLKTKDKATAKYLQSKKDQELVESNTPVLDSLAQTILNEYDRTVSPYKRKSTHYRDMQNIRRFLGAAHIQKISDISEKNLQDYFNGKIGAGLSVLTVNRNMASIKTFLKFALRRKYIFSNPMEFIKQHKPEKNMPRFLDKDELKRVLKEAKKEDIYPCVITGIYTGLRQSELFTLEWTDIDFARDTITVQNKEGFQTKSKKFRVIPLHPRLKAVLRRLKRKEGRCFDVINHRRAFNRILRNAKVKDSGIGWHILRHTFASMLAMKGVDLVTISQLLGHADIKTTMIYAHLTGDHVKGAISRINF